MRLGLVIGNVVLNPSLAEFKGLRLVLVQPMNASDLEAMDGTASGKTVVAVDRLGANIGQVVGFTEGREAANPFWPQQAPVDAYCALIVKQAALEPSTLFKQGSEVRK